ncbi:MAG: lysophospholipid acyltransferase family protein [Candidatus Omnitrophica bacterium]|nr:lysophospholipid acyltransferase family protein [Candidatus Omnitrophota bacterium]
MNCKNLGKTISRFLSWGALITCSLIIRFLPERGIYALANILANIVFFVAPRQRKIAFNSLSIAFGSNKPPRELRAIAKDCFRLIAKSGVEDFYFLNNRQLLKKRVSIENRRILEQALSRNKGVIIVSGHFGNFPLMMFRLKVEGYPVGGIMRPMRDKRTGKMFTKMIDESGVKNISSQPRKACVDTTIRALKNNEIVCIQLDQNFGTAGVFVNFLGQKAATATGPVVFALRTKAALIPCFIIRDKDDAQRIIFEPEFHLVHESEYNDTIMTNIQKLTDIIESYIRRYPAHWGWIHRRWKTRPKGNTR